jgi:hypothetical protein
MRLERVIGSVGMIMRAACLIRNFGANIASESRARQSLNRVRRNESRRQSFVRLSRLPRIHLAWAIGEQSLFRSLLSDRLLPAKPTVNRMSGSVHRSPQADRQKTTQSGREHCIPFRIFSETGIRGK